MKNFCLCWNFSSFSNSYIKQKQLNLFIHHSNTRLGDKNRIFVVVESCSILYSRKIVCLQVDWFTGYNGIMVEHSWSRALWNIGVYLKFLSSVNCQTTIAFRTILSLHFHHLWFRHILHHIFPSHMWVRHNVRNVGLLYFGFPFPVGPPSNYRSFQAYF